MIQDICITKYLPEKKIPISVIHMSEAVESKPVNPSQAILPLIKRLSDDQPNKDKYLSTNNCLRHNTQIIDCKTGVTIYQCRACVGL